MASKPKKAKTNGFLLFAQEFSVRFEILQIYFTKFTNLQRKNQLAMPFEDLKGLASPHWNNLSEEDKKIYKEKAKPSNGIPSLPAAFNPNNQAQIEARLRQAKHEAITEEVRLLIQNAYDMNGKFKITSKKAILINLNCPSSSSLHSFHNHQWIFIL